MSTFSAKGHEVQRKWFVVDASGQVLGRLASQIAYILRGKHKPIFTSHVDTGDYVVVLNADKVVLTGRKEQDKIYYRHSEFPGGLKSTNAADLRAKHPTHLVEKAVKGMLPHNVLGREVFRKLKVYAGTEHPHVAQKPEAFPLSRTAQIKK